MTTDVSGDMQQHSANSESENVRGRWTSWFIFAAFLLPMVAAYLMFTTGVGLPTKTINKGTLLEPATSIRSLNITSAEGAPIDFSAEKKWRWLIVGSNDCQQACLDNLYITRQVHIRLGEKAVRLERFYLNTDAEFSAAFASQLEQEHPRLVQAHVDAESWKKTFNNTNVAAIELDGAELYVIDQEGFAMMTYGVSNSGEDMLDDIKRLLKYSYEE
ncbi:hypothetical protein KOI40_02780 [Aestuariicella sp. G3-2]|uniref:hypothetical protein n=1 Tax=Pseudomaricurvus albidus TaxID=2842452 RepID=UPI001C0AD7D5|nr:hypothetical protein [Aestuariicella albida]MBU3068726.1 hypothetical protein [Aestuariicella albida]